MTTGFDPASLGVTSPIEQAVERLAARLHNKAGHTGLADQGRQGDCYQWARHRYDARVLLDLPYPMSGSGSKSWPIVINDAPVRCGRCDEAIIGSGTGTLTVLAEALNRHLAECRFIQDILKGAL